MNNKVYLRAFEFSDLSLINKWHNDLNINQMTGGNKHFVSSELDRKWLEDRMMNNNKDVYCAICLVNDDKMIGYISLNNIDFINRKASWGGIVIGESIHRNKGYASKAAFLIFKYGFEELNLQKITGRWIEANDASIIIGKMMGFVEEGRLKDEVYKNGKYHNIVLMSLFKDTFKLVKKNFEE